MHSRHSILCMNFWMTVVVYRIPKSCVRGYIPAFQLGIIDRNHLIGERLTSRHGVSIDHKLEVFSDILYLRLITAGSHLCFSHKMFTHACLWMLLLIGCLLLTLTNILMLYWNYVTSFKQKYVVKCINSWYNIVCDNKAEIMSWFLLCIYGIPIQPLHWCCF